MGRLLDWKFGLLLALTLGLAPFFPEPHLFGKIRWIMGGAVGMATMDWIDFVWHAWPWILLIWALARRFRQARKKGTA